MERVDEPLVSLVVPVFNEESAIPVFLDSVKSLLESSVIRIEVLFVNDGSTDGTLQVIVEAIQRVDFASIRCVNLSRNFGKESALSAGLCEASGDVLVPIDVDLQDPPGLVIDFLEKWRDGYDVVYGVRVCRRADTFTKKISANSFYKLFNKVSSTNIPENVGDYRLIDRRVVNVINQLPERNRFMKGIFSWVGFKSIGVPYHRSERAVGETKWNYWKLWNFAIDGITSFSTVPLKIWSYIGVIMAFGAFAYMSFIIIRTVFFGIDAAGYPSLMSVVLFLGGVQLITLGVIGEYVGRLFNEVKGRPIYIVENIYEKDMKNAGNR